MAITTQPTGAKGLGASVKRKEDPKFLTGHGRYTDDINVPGALHLAIQELASGRADMALTGGMDTFNDIFMYMCFSKTPALSPSGDAKPFERLQVGACVVAVSVQESLGHPFGDRKVEVVATEKRVPRRCKHFEDAPG